MKKNLLNNILIGGGLLIMSLTGGDFIYGAVTASDYHAKVLAQTKNIEEYERIIDNSTRNGMIRDVGGFFGGLIALSAGMARKDEREVYPESPAL